LKIYRILLEYIFPSTCGVCGKICADSLCKKCELSLRKLEVSKKQIKIRKDEDYILFYEFPYTDIIRQMLLEFKFKDKPYIAKTFVKIMLQNEKVCRFLKSYDIIIPVPAYFLKKWKRGYNQTEQIIKEISKICPEIRYDFHILKKNKNTKRQSSLKRIDRKTNLNGAYKVENKDRIQDKKVLLLDDIYTTGSTVKACAKVLKEAGAKELGIFVIAKD